MQSIRSPAQGVQSHCLSRHQLRRHTLHHTRFQPQHAPSTVSTHFRKSIEQAADDLRSHGWAVIDNVLEPDECDAYMDGVWRWLGSLGGGICKDDPCSWQGEAWPPTFKGIINTLEVSHQDFVWNIRKHPKILQVFSALYGQNDLLSSFDSINCSRPGANEQAGWVHVDQAPLRRGMYCIQGLVNLVNVGPDTTGTLMVKDKSHLAHERFFKEHSCLTPEEQATTKDFYIFQPQELPFWDSFESHAVSGKAGSLFLWDSRTAHQNVSPPVSDSWRHVCYVCHQPRALALPEELELKQQAYKDYRVTTHWPAHNVTLFPEIGSDYYSSSKVENAADDKGSAEGGVMGPAKSAKKEPTDYWGRRTADGSIKRTLESIRTRDAVEDRTLLQLAGVLEYEPHDIVKSEPLLEFSFQG